MNEQQDKLLSLLSALKATKDEKKNVMKNFKEQIQGIERQIEEIRLAALLTDHVLTAST